MRSESTINCMKRQADLAAASPKISSIELLDSLEEFDL